MTTGPATAGTYPAFLDHPDAEQRPCLNRDPDLFFSDRPNDITEAKTICGSCPLRIRCRTWALNQPVEQVYGVWGGTSHKDRKALKRPSGGNQPRGVAA